jgi:hypothetical protein
MSWFLLTIQIALSCMFLVAASAKVLRPDELTAALRVSGLPERALAPVGTIVAVLEAGLAAALVLQTPRSLPIAFGLVALLLAVFAAWMAWVRARGLRVACGCFGMGSGEVGMRTIWRNLALLALSLGALLLVRRTSSPLPGPSVWLVVMVSAIALWVALLVTLRTALPGHVFSLDMGRSGSGPGREG